ncbi:MAG: YfhO family protein [Acidobacteriaceae bacterium]|nr:YfhO family protein [Acidobacteriaceae bacterium]
MILPKTLDPAAAAWFTEPSLAITGWEYWQAKALPLWNPYQGLGQPYAADMQSQPFFPLTVLFSLHTTPKTYNLFLLCRLLIAGMGGYLFLRLFTSFIPAIAGGIAMMLAGYFILYISMPCLSVETLTPITLFAAESLTRNPSKKSMCGFAVAIALVILGGMPESSLLTYTLVYSFVLFRIISDASLRHMWIKRTAYVTAATIIGLALVAFLLLPMVELLHHSYNIHEPAKNGGFIPGLRRDKFDLSIFTYFLPLIFGQPFALTLSYLYNGNGARNYWGVVPLFLSLIALFSITKSEGVSNRKLSRATYFFLGWAVILILKRYGIQPIDALGNLPLFRMVNLLTYDEPLLSTCIAVLSGIGLERIVTRTASWRTQTVALFATFALVAICVLLSLNVLVDAISKNHLSPAFPLVALGLPLCLLFGLALCQLIFQQDGKVGSAGRNAAIAIALCIAIEMSLNYIPEIYYSFGQLPNISENPYAGAPYVHWLKANRFRNDRIFARGGALFPDWASAFQLPDVRDLDALYYWKYLPFVRNFMLASGQSGTDDFRDRFTGAGSYAYGFTNPLERRLLQLTSVRYLITNVPYFQADFQLEYDREVKIYSYNHVLPRVALYYSANVASNDEQVLKTLASPNFEIFDTVVLNSVQLTPAQRADVDVTNRGEPRPVEAGSITVYEPMKIEIEASLPQSGILVLNDCDYPGWEASVDGMRSKIISADYIFRGLLLRPGKHRIRFAYRPRSFRLGAIISASALVGLLFCSVDLRRMVRVKSHF